MPVDGWLNKFSQPLKPRRLKLLATINFATIGPEIKKPGPLESGPG
jgi:hypothetical protein